MATAKTGSFYLTETLTLPNTLTDGLRATGSIDLGAYVNVATGQAIAVESVDFIFQDSAGLGSCVRDMVSDSGSIGIQLTDLNPNGAFVRADNQSLIASASLNIDRTGSTASNGNKAYHVADLYPDNFGPASLSEAFMVVNDTLHLVGGPDSCDIGASDVLVTARVKCRIAKLSNKDFVAIAIQSTAADN